MKLEIKTNWEIRNTLEIQKKWISVESLKELIKEYRTGSGTLRFDKLLLKKLK